MIFIFFQILRNFQKTFTTNFHNLRKNHEICYCKGENRPEVYSWENSAKSSLEERFNTSQLFHSWSFLPLVCLVTDFFLVGESIPFSAFAVQ